MRSGRIGGIGVALLFACAAAGCASQRAEGPLFVSLGMSRGETASALRHYDFCAQVEPAKADEVYPQCDRPGTGYGDAWVIAHYDTGRLVRVQRFERWVDDTRAAERWNQLVEKRALKQPVSPDARARISARQPVPEGTTTWAAFQSGEDLVGVYLLEPPDGNGPRILEEILPGDAPLGVTE
jgi:hypothetical protein